jgi:hypothetical protein
MRMAQGRVPPRAHHLQAEQVKHAVHAICNRVVEDAARHGARVAVNDVTYLRRQLVRAPEEGGAAAPRSQAWHEQVAERHYRRATLVCGEMVRILGYKLPRRGLPRPLAISGISPRDCASCGRRGTEKDLCGFCGAPLDGLNAARATCARLTAVLDRARAKREQAQTE